MTAMTDNGIINKPSKHSVEETLERLERTLQGKGVEDFAAAAAE
jgi:hypothetical protein